MTGLSGAVEAPVWGTFSVLDHLAPEPFLREALIFDRLVVPYPDPNMPGEWDRWTHPDPNDPKVTWNPARLQEILAVLGTEAAPGYNGARLVQRSMWNPHTWEMVRSNAEIAELASGNPYYATALGISSGKAGMPVIPDLVEAVAAYRSEADFRSAKHPTPEPWPSPGFDPQTGRIPTMEALIRVARPLLVPTSDGDDLDKLRAAVDLTRSPDFQDAKRAYYTWFRDFISPFRGGPPTEALPGLDAASISLMQDRLRELLRQEVAAAKRVDKARWGKRIELGCMSVGTVGGIGLAALAALPAVGVPIAALSFIGWAARRFSDPPPPRSLSGASMFLDAQRRLGWLQPEQ